MNLKTRGNLLPILGLALAVILVAFLIFNQAKALGAVRARFVEQELLLSQSEARLRSLIEISKDEAEAKERLLKFQDLVPDDPLEEKLITDLQTIADVSSMKFLLIRFGERVNKDSYIEIPMTIAFEGRYPHLLHFLPNLEEMGRAIRIEEVKIGRGRNELPEIVASIKASAFYMGDKE